MSRVVLGTADVVGTILDVQAVPTKSGKVKYDVAFSDGKKYATFKQEIATAAANLKGQQGITIRVEQSQNGQYTNLDLVEIGPMTPLVNGGAPVVGAAFPAPGISAPAAIPAGITMAPARDFEKETRGKVRHGAIIAGLEAAARTSQGETDQELFGRAVNFATAVEQYVFETGAFGAITEPQALAQSAPVPPTPEPVSVEALVEQGVVQVGTAAVQPQAQAQGGLPWQQ